MTNSIVEFVCHLSDLSINLEIDGDRLRCHAPEGALTPTLRQQIGSRKTEIMLFLQQAQQVKASHQISIPPVPRDGHLPLSFAQQRLWFVHQLSPDRSAYNMLQALRLEGSLNLVALQQSVSELIRRHEILRTTFSTVDGEPIQVITPATTLNLPVDDWQGLSESDQTAQIRQMAKSQASEPFDLAVGPLVQFTLLQLASQEYVLLLKMHHIIYDGWSLSVFIRELSELYAAYTHGLPYPLAELPIQYADFAVWQRQWLTGVVLERQLNYWQEQLAGVPPVLELPAAQPRSPVQTFRGGIEGFQLDQQLTQRLKQLSQESDATLFMTLLAAFGVLISRYSGQLDIVVGSPIANRNNAQIEHLIGFFTNIIALRVDLSTNPSFQDLLAQVRQRTLGAYSHQDLPFDMLVEKLQPERDLSRHPLVQVMFALQNAPTSALSLPGLTIQNMPLPVDATSRFDLEVDYSEVSGGLEGIWCYNADLFDATTITRMGQHFHTLLQAIAANPRAPIAELPLLTIAERHQLLVEWNDTQVDYPQGQCIHQLFEAQVERTPDAVALMWENQHLTYHQLNCRANQLAHYLKSLGVESEVLVGLCVERSVEMVVGLLGILKAGGAYVPLDPQYPTERLSFMLEDALVKVLLTQEQLVEKLLEHHIQLVCLDSDWNLICESSHFNLVNITIPENIAYVIYTSGSTGLPKGVMIPHSSLVNFTQATIVDYGLSDGDRLLQFASISFDVAAAEIYPGLSCGATLVLRTEEMLSSIHVFMQKCRDWALTVLDLPTAYWHQITVELASANLLFPNSIRLVVIGGEPLLPQQLRMWQQHIGEYPQLINAYGPTEATITATLCKLLTSSITEIEQQKISIGRPIGNVQIYILDEYLQPVPIGVPGELHIGGASLGRGYLNRSELTQEKFIPNPFKRSRGAKEDQSSNSDRLYKTGDLARYLPDGNIEYLGRIDFQVKIRGFRIELGEIEAVLNQHSDVHASCAIARVDTTGDQRLFAYVVPHQNSTPTTSLLRQFLASQLPGYMVPNTFVMLKTLPLTPNGKIDIRALPAPNTQTSEDTRKIAPRDTVELQLAQIWSEVLDINQVGVQENFFEIGGHSLLAVRLISRIQRQFGKNLPLTTLFQNGTVEQLATLLRQEKISQTGLPLIPIQSTGSKPPFFCIHPVGGNVLCYADLARHLGTEQPFYGLQAVGLNEHEEPKSSIEDMAAVYIKAIRGIQPTGPYYLGGWSMGGIIALEMAQQLSAKGYEVALLALIDSYIPTLISPVIVEDHLSLPSLEELDDTIEVYYFVKDMASILNLEISVPEDKLRYLKQDDLLRYILDWTKTANVLPPEFSEEQIRSWFRLFQANGRALSDYISQPYSGRTVFFCANETTVEDSGWSKVISGLEKELIPGNHYAIITSPILAQKLSNYLT